MLGQIGLPGGGFGFGYSATNHIGGQYTVPPAVPLPQGKNSVDSFFSQNESEFKKYVSDIKQVEIALDLPKENNLNGFKSMRSIYVSNKILKGDKITKHNIKIVRPGHGLHPKYYNKILGLRVNRNIDFGERLKSVLSSFMFSDVSSNEVNFFTINQWFDETFFNENAMQNLSPQAMQALDMHLTPAVKQALGELLGSEVAGMVQDIGPNQPTISIPISVIASAYPTEGGDIKESIRMMEEDFRSKAGQGQQEIPSSPQGGLGGAPMGAPPTNVPPVE